jgi:hypothetical protein
MMHRKRTMNENEDAIGKFFIVGSNGRASDPFESFSWTLDRLLRIVGDVKIHLAGGSVSYWIEAADGVLLTVNPCRQRLLRRCSIRLQGDGR